MLWREAKRHYPPGHHELNSTLNLLSLATRQSAPQLKINLSIALSTWTPSTLRMDVLTAIQVLINVFTNLIYDSAVTTIVSFLFFNFYL